MKIPHFLKKIVSLILLFCFCALIGKGWYLIRDGFVLRRVICFETQPSLELGWNEEAKAVMEQRFTSFGRGRQSYAFLSEDGNYVIKIPRYDRYRFPLWRKVLNCKFLSLKEKEYLRKKTGMASLIQSFRLAFDHLKEETAVIAVRFPGNRAKGEFIKIVDRLGRCYDLPLERTGFVLQYKKEILNSVLQNFLFTSDHEQLAFRLDQILAVIADRARKGILCKDDAFMHNFGFDQTKAYQIDVGDFILSEETNRKLVFEKSVRDNLISMRKWIEEIDPDFLPIFDDKVEVIIKSEFL